MRIALSTTWKSQYYFFACTREDRTWDLIEALAQPEGLIFIDKSLELPSTFVLMMIAHIHLLVIILVIIVSQDVSVIRISAVW